MTKKNVVPKDALCPETNATNTFSDFCDVYFLRYGRFCTQILSELETLTIVSSTLCEPDSEMLTSDTR